jgi:hypothetical protein
MKQIALVSCVALLLAAAPALAQLAPDAVHLGRVKISEVQKSDHLDPVTLETADPALATWEHDGVTYGASAAGSKEKFMADPAVFIEPALKKRWENNFLDQMSIIWCPVTDEVSAGGGLLWDELGLDWESCCQFCNETKTDEDFPRGLENLQRRAADSYILTKNGTYQEGFSSVVFGAIDLTGEGWGEEEESEETTQAAEAEVEAEIVPAWLAGKTLKPTWDGGVGLLFEYRCVECHRKGGVAPMDFMSLGKVKQWSENLKTNIEMSLMPPFPAGGKHKYANGKFLTQHERDVILEWIEAGYPEGEAMYKFTRNWRSPWEFGTPDHEFELPEVILEEDAAEVIKEFEIETSFDEDKWIAAAQIIPTDSFLTMSVEAGPLGSYHPGNPVKIAPKGTAWLLKKGEKVKVSIFYTKEPGWEEFDDETRFGIKFADAPATPILTDRMANESLTIPAGKAGVEATSEFTFASDGQILAVTPVARERAKKVNVTVTLPNGDKKELVNIGYWNAMWQFTYELSAPLAAPKGTVVTMKVTYDNSAENAKNPDATVDVKAGPNGELLEGWINYTLN